MKTTVKSQGKDTYNFEIIQISTASGISVWNYQMTMNELSIIDGRMSMFHFHCGKLFQQNLTDTFFFPKLFHSWTPI